jgi:hypothetical protein
MAPPTQGYVQAAYLDMAEVFGQPEKPKMPEWKLDGGTLVCGTGREHEWVIAGWSRAAVDQVIGLAARAGRFGRVAKAKGGETVHVTQAPAVQLAEGEA